MTERAALAPGRRTTYEETFDQGAGGWGGWRRHHENVPLTIHDGVATLRSPFGIDSNHAPPGAGYLSLLAFLYTIPGAGPAFTRPNRFVEGSYSRDLTSATFTVRMRGDVRLRGAEVTLLVQAHAGPRLANFVLTGQSLAVTPDWSEQSLRLVPERSQWVCLGGRHNMREQYGYGDIVEALQDVDNDLILVLYPLTIVPSEPTDDIHRLRPDHDYAVDRRYLPQGEIQLDTIRLSYPT